MVSPRLLGVAETVVVVIGALLVGDTLHRAFTLGLLDPTSPAVLLRAFAGVALVLLGYTLPRVLTGTGGDGSTPGDERSARVPAPDDGSKPEDE